MGTYLQLHLHPIHRQYLVLKENGKGGEGCIQLQDAQGDTASPHPGQCFPQTLRLIPSCFLNSHPLVPAPAEPWPSQKISPCISTSCIYLDT